MISSESAVRRSPDGNEGNDPAVRLLAAITSAQKKALGKHDAGEIFEAMLEETLALTASAFGFMGEVLHSPEDKPFLKTHALTNISWNLSLIHISEPTRRTPISYAVFCLK